MRKILLRATTTLAMMVGVLAGLALVWSSPALAETFAVTNTNESGAGSLRQAIENANAAPGSDTVTFSGPSSTGTITLESVLTVSSSLTIEGPGTDRLTVSGNDTVRVFHLRGGSSLSLSGLTVARGRAGAPITGFTDVDDSGGGIFSVNSILNLEDVALRDNSAPAAGGEGGAVFSANGTVNIQDSAFSGNSAGEYGGAVSATTVPIVIGFECEKITVSNSAFSGNSALLGGAIFNAPGCQMSVADGSRIDGNSTPTESGRVGSGGGIFNRGTLAIAGSSLSNNHAEQGGGLFSSGELTVDRTTLSTNTAVSLGGGLYNVGSATVRRSTLSGNGAPGSFGGAVYNLGPLRVEGSTFFGNEATDGSAIENDRLRGGSQGVAVVQGATITGNSSARRTVSSLSGSVTFESSLVAGNADDADAWPNTGLIDGGFNLLSGTADEVGLETDSQGDPALADNGGPTRTVALVRGGDAIDAGDSFGSTTDQRGTPRPKDYASADNAQSGDGSDIGAFEYVDPDNAAPTVVASASPPPDEGGFNNSDVTVSMNASDEGGGSGVWRTSYSAGGAQQVSEQNVAGNSAELVVSADGETTVTYWATDRAGNRSESRTITLRVDKTPPETSISSGPSGPTRRTSASFAFSSPDAGATFECSLDGSAFRPCSSPEFLTGLADGKRAYSVRAIDAAGNPDATPATRTWLVDTVGPTGKARINGGRTTTAAREVTLRLDARDPAPGSGVVSMRFKNGGPEAWSAWQPYARSKSWRLKAGAGKKTVHVQYKDAAGNVSASTSDSIGYRP